MSAKPTKADIIALETAYWDAMLAKDVPPEQLLGLAVRAVPLETSEWNPLIAPHMMQMNRQTFGGTSSVIRRTRARCSA